MLKLILILKITHRAARQAVVLGVAAGLVGCSSRPGAPDSGEPMRLPDGGLPVSRAQVVTAAAECALTSAKQFRDAAAALQQATGPLAAAPDAPGLAAARAAFEAAMDVWELNEALQYGPAALSSTMGGKDLREQINSWPLFSRCGVEEQLVSKSYESGARKLLINRRGMMALEYLLFYEGDATACPADSAIVLQGTWAALSQDERAARRRAYAAAVAADVKAWADQLVAEWDPGFMTTMTTAGAGSPLFTSSQAALNVVSDAVFYIDASVINFKLAPALGLRSECIAPPCVELLESQHAGRSKRNVAQNLIGLRLLLQGCGPQHAGIGFDDLLAGVGAEGTAQRLHDATGAMQSAVDAIDEPDLEEALAADPASVRAVYDAAKVITGLLKTEFLTVLDLELPKTLEGDND